MRTTLGPPVPKCNDGDPQPVDKGVDIVLTRVHLVVDIRCRVCGLTRRCRGHGPSDLQSHCPQACGKRFFL